MSDMKQKNSPAKSQDEVDLDALGDRWISNLAQTQAEQIAAVDGDKNARHLLHMAIHMACLTDENANDLRKAVTLAAFERDEDSSTTSIIPSLIRQLSGIVSADVQSVDNYGLKETVPDFSAAPRNEFRGVHEDGDPYAYLMANYGPWLLKGRECLDRPTLAQFDGKLLKALQQRAVRKPGSMPHLSDIFPGKVAAMSNQHTYMAGRVKKAS